MVMAQKLAAIGFAFLLLLKCFLKTHLVLLGRKKWVHILHNFLGLMVSRVRHFFFNYHWPQG